MQLVPDDELRRLCTAIVATPRNEQEWRDRASDDEFQSDHFVGGYDAIEDAFTFSHYTPDGAEWWFQLTIDDVRTVADGGGPAIEMRSPG